MSTVRLNTDDKKVRHKLGCYIMLTFLLVIMLQFIITINCCYYTKNR